MNVLLVEDETLVRRFIKSLIDWEDSDYTIAGEAANGEEALKLLQTEPIDIVLTDIRMPLMSGFELIERIHELGLSCEIIILSSYDEFEYVRKALKMQVSDYVHKATISEEELLAALNKARGDWVKHQEQLIIDRMIRHSHLGRRQQVAANVLKLALEPDADKLHLQLLSEQLGIWNEPFTAALMRTAEPIPDALLTNDDWIVFAYMNDWLIVGRGSDVPSLMDSESGPVIVCSERRILLDEWPALYEELTVKLDERLQEQESMRGLHVSIQRAIEYLHEHYMDELTLEVMSELVHISPAYFSRLFMKETGQTFTDYLTALRLSRAKSMLSQSSLPVYEIAEHSGYRNTRYFSKLFKESMGMTPTEYRIHQSQEK